MKVIYFILVDGHETGTVANEFEDAKQKGRGILTQSAVTISAMQCGPAGERRIGAPVRNWRYDEEVDDWVETS